jgi:integrase
MMAKRQKHRLTVKEVQNATKDLADGFGLWLQYTPKYDSRSWLFRYRFDSADRQMGLGSTITTSLAEARKRAQDARDLIARGIDPREARNKAKRERMEAAAKRKTFKECADLYIAANRPSWRSDKHTAQWLATFNGPNAATASINDMSVADVDTAHVVKVLAPIWFDKPETASRARGRIERVLGWATVGGFRSGDNPARWEGHLRELLPAKTKLAKVEHHAALPYVDVPAFMAQLRTKQGLSARALEFTILTAARVGEVLGARWNEIDLAAKTWSIPGSRMKAGDEHVVPLSDRALAILDAQPPEGELVFPGRRGKLSDQSLRDMAQSVRAGVTVHGWRSSFRDWCGDQTNFPREIVEHALAHKVANGTELAYRRGSALEKRRKLMSAWASYCEQPPVKSGENVVPLKQDITKV